ncbi:MAG: glycine oxidase ThiO [Actinobacteria bacterium]|nr:glycine oxidase ThiO [Actinomycetota bacterium]
MAHQRRLVVVGAGVIGLASAWRAAQSGWAVTVLDPHPMHGASWAAAGMLAPITESTPAEPGVLDVGLRSARLWPKFAEELTASAGQPCGFHDAATLVVGYDRDDRTELERLQSQLTAHALQFERITTARLRELEPAVSAQAAAALLVAGDRSVDNRALLGALDAALYRMGVPTLRERAVSVSARQVVCASGLSMDADAVLVAAGVDTPALVPSVDVRPVKGQIIRVMMTASTGRLLSHTVRGLVRGRHVYLVPRSNGEIVIGATMEERGRDISVTVGGVGELLEDARLLVPGLDECELVETWAGLRPVSRDNLPIMRTVDDVIVNTGHGRNGILLTPLASDEAARLLNQLAAGASDE